MEQDWVAKQEQRKNARWMRFAIAIAVLTGVFQTIALARLPERKPGDPEIVVTVEDIYYTWPDGTSLTIDRATWQTYLSRPDGTLCIGEVCRPFNPPK